MKENPTWSSKQEVTQISLGTFQIYVIQTRILVGKWIDLGVYEGKSNLVSRVMQNWTLIL